MPAPVLFNPWKHHAGWLREQIEETIRAGAPALEILARQLRVMGSEVMDLYVGQLAPAEIAGKVRASLQAAQRLELSAYRSWLESQGGFQVLVFDPDQSRWVLRLGDERYVHVHPGRWSPATKRVRANVLKTAVMVLAYANIHGRDPVERLLVNQVRKEFLGPAPVGKELAGDQGIGGVIAVLRDRS